MKFRMYRDPLKLYQVISFSTFAAYVKMSLDWFKQFKVKICTFYICLNRYKITNTTKQGKGYHQLLLTTTNKKTMGIYIYIYYTHTHTHTHTHTQRTTI